MSTTKLADVVNQIQKYWSPRFTDELRESLLLGGLVAKDYEGEIKEGGDTVRVEQVAAATGELLDVGVNADSFNSEKVVTTYVDIKADKRAVASYKFEDLVKLQSLISQDNPKVIESMKFAISKQINDYIYGLLSPNTTPFNNVITGVATFALSNLQAVRKLAAQNKWAQDGQWYGLMDPNYYTDTMGVVNLTSSDYVGDQVVVSGQSAIQRLGFKLLEDNSRTTKQAVFFHPSFLQMVMQTQVTVKVSDLHPLGQFGYIMSADIVFGAKLAVDGGARHITVGP